MAEMDLQTLLERVSMGQGDARDMQLIALEELCMQLLMSDNADRCFESCPPRTFLPALCRIFLDECAPENVLEVTARAITYYLDVSAECTRRIVAMEGAVKAICNRLVVAEFASRTSKDLAEQCVKVLELICTREAGAVFEAGGLSCILPFIRDNGSRVHKDTLHSAMAVVSRLCTKMEPQDAQLPQCVESLSTLLRHEDSHVSDGAVQCFASVANSMSGRKYQAMPDERVLKKLYLFSEEFFDSFTSNLVTYFYVLRQIKNNAKQTKEFTISGRSLSTASNAFINASEELGKLVNNLQILKKEKTLKTADLENWTLRVYSRSSTLKKTLLETALDIFQSYEMLFMDNATEQEISKYADEAAKKILKHFVSPGEKSVADRATLTNIITRSENSNRTIIQCCLGSLLTELLRTSPDEKKNSVEKYFSSVGIWHNGQVYVNDKSKPKKYFYRRLFTTENNKIPDNFHPSDFNLKMYNYLLDSKDLENVLVQLENHFIGRDITESKIKQKIASIKCRISEERREISTNYSFDVLEDLTDAMDDIGRIAEKEDKEEEEEKAASVPSGSNQIYNVKSSKIVNWKSVF